MSVDPKATKQLALTDEEIAVKREVSALYIQAAIVSVAILVLTAVIIAISTWQILQAIR